MTALGETQPNRRPLSLEDIARVIGYMPTVVEGPLPTTGPAYDARLEYATQHKLAEPLPGASQPVQPSIIPPA